MGAPGRVICEGTGCGNQGDDRYTGQTDRDGCQLQSYKNGKHDFYGPGKTVVTTRTQAILSRYGSFSPRAGKSSIIPRMTTCRGTASPMNIAQPPRSISMQQLTCLAIWEA